MYVKNYMSTDLVTITPDTTVIKALDLMRQHDIHRLPVVVKGQLVGLLTESVIAKNSPSTATSLSVHELNYLLNKTTAADIMSLPQAQMPSWNKPLPRCAIWTSVS